MKLAAARAGLWFFGIIIFIFVIGSDHFKDEPFGEVIATLLFFGVIVGGTVFFWTWHQVVEEDRRLEVAERNKALSDTVSDEGK